jgi:hypothetical protein
MRLMYLHPRLPPTSAAIDQPTNPTRYSIPEMTFQVLISRLLVIQVHCIIAQTIVSMHYQSRGGKFAFQPVT